MMFRAATDARRKAEHWGRFAEWLCVLRLRLTGWQVLSRRMVARRGTGLGEIDIVARRGKVVAFVEVKARTTFEQALEAVTLAQQRRISRAAAVFLARRPELAECSARFDVMYVGPRLLPRRLADAWRP